MADGSEYQIGTLATSCRWRCCFSPFNLSALHKFPGLFRLPQLTWEPLILGGTWQWTGLRA